MLSGRLTFFPCPTVSTFLPILSYPTPFSVFSRKSPTYPIFAKIFTDRNRPGR